MENINEYQIIYKSIIFDEGIKVNQLPDEIRKKIRGFVPTYENSKKDPENKNKFLGVKRQDLEITKKIQDWLDKDLVDESESERNIRRYLLANDNKISEKQIRTFCGGKLPNGNPCEIGGMTLKRGFLKSYYQLIK